MGEDGQVGGGVPPHSSLPFVEGAANFGGTSPQGSGRQPRGQYFLLSYLQEGRKTPCLPYAPGMHPVRHSG
jgi:hypothetical protein